MWYNLLSSIVFFSIHAALNEINAVILGRQIHLFKSDFVCALLLTVTPYSRTPILWLSTSLLWPAASTLPTALGTSYLHFTPSALGRNDRATAKRYYLKKEVSLLCHYILLSLLCCWGHLKGQYFTSSVVNIRIWIRTPEN